jgi:hypothetical protein
MQNAERQIVSLVVLLVVSVAEKGARGQELVSPAGETFPYEGTNGSVQQFAPDAGTSQLSHMAPGHSHPVFVETRLADTGDATASPSAVPGAKELPSSVPQPKDVARGCCPGVFQGHVARSVFEENPGWTGEDVTAVALRTSTPSSDQLPILGVMLDVGVPDGLMGSLVARPWSWLHVSAGGGTNTISRGWRAGVTFLPFSEGLSASLEYGRYQDGDANPLARKFVDDGFDGSPVLDRVGYEFMNAHLGLDFGIRHVVFFLHGGLTMLQGQVHNLNTSLGGAAGAGTTDVVVRQDPSFKAVGPSVKVGLLVYIW